MKAIANHISFADYRKHEAENNSGLKHMGKSPKEYLYRKTHGRDDTEALSLGRHVHTAVLEPQLFSPENYAVFTGAKKQGKSWDVFLDQHWGEGWAEFREEWAKENERLRSVAININPFSGEMPLVPTRAAKAPWQQYQHGKQVLGVAEFNTIIGCRDAVLANEHAARLIRKADNEVSVFWQHRFGLKCKMRADLLRTTSKPFLADLKTGQDASPDVFDRAAAKYEYHVQLGMYQAGVKALTGELVPVYIIAAEKTPPFDCVVYKVPQLALNVGRGVFEDRLMRVVKCRESGKWPGAGEGIETLELPNWVFEDDVLDWSEMAV